MDFQPAAPAPSVAGTETDHGLLGDTTDLRVGDILFCNEKQNHTVVVFHVPPGSHRAGNVDDIVLLSAANDFKHSAPQYPQHFTKGERAGRAPAERGLGVAQFMTLRDFNKMALLITMARALSARPAGAGDQGVAPGPLNLVEAASYLLIRRFRLS